MTGVQTCALPISKGSDASAGMTIPCRSAILDISMRFGVGYQIPQAVTSAINFILRKLNVRTIEGSDGTDHTESLISKKDAFPAGCADK